MSLKNLKIKPRDFPVFYIAEREDACFEKLKTQVDDVTLSSLDELKGNVAALDSSHFVKVDKDTYLPGSFWSEFMQIGKSPCAIHRGRLNVVNAHKENCGVTVASVDYVGNGSIPRLATGEISGVYKSNPCAKLSWENGFRFAYDHCNRPGQDSASYRDVSILTQWLTLGRDVSYGTWMCLGALEAMANDLEGVYTTELLWADEYQHWQNEDSIFNSRHLLARFKDLQGCVQGGVDIFEAEASQLTKLMLAQEVRADVIELMLNL